jgi:hypothetical protein
MELIDKYKYIALAVLVIVTALVYSVTDMVVKVAAVMHPSVKVITVTRAVEKKNVVVVKREVVFADGHRETEERSEDRSTSETNASSDSHSVPVVPSNPRGWTLWTGGGIGLDRAYHGTVGASVGPVLVTVDNPVWPASLNPRVTAAVGWAF